MTINEMIEKEILEYLQKKWNWVKRCEEIGMDVSVRMVDMYMEAEKFAEHLTGRQIEVNAIDRVCFVEEVHI